MEINIIQVLVTGTFVLALRYVISETVSYKVFHVSDMAKAEHIYTETLFIESGKIVYFMDGNHTVQIIGPEGGRLLFIFEQLFTVSDQDRLEIYDDVRYFGEKNRTLNLLGNFSGRFVPRESVLTFSNAATLNFTQTRNCTNRCYGPSRYTLIFSVVLGNGPYCQSNEFECAEGLCLSNVLECDGITNCGKYTDTDSTCSRDSILVLGVLGASLAVIVVVIVVCVVVCCRRKTTHGHVFRQRGGQRSRPLSISQRVRFNNRQRNVVFETPSYPGEPPKPPPYSVTDPVKDDTPDLNKEIEPPPPYTELPVDNT